MIKEPTTADIAFEIPTGEVYTVVEIVGMILGHAKFLAESPERLAVTGAVITVPPYFAQQERQALLDAAHVAGLRPAWLVNSDTAGAHFFPTKTKRIRPLTHSLTHFLSFFLFLKAALHFGMTKKFYAKQHHIFYDMGAGCTTVSLVSFQTNQTATLKKTTETNAFQVESTCLPLLVSFCKLLPPERKRISPILLPSSRYHV